MEIGDNPPQRVHFSPEGPFVLDGIQTAVPEMAEVAAIGNDTEKRPGIDVSGDLPGV